jgi:adenylate cyclase
MDLKTITGVQPEIFGNVRKAGNQIRITAQLVDVATDAYLWSETYSASVENFFTMQENISRSVAKALQVTLLGADQQMNHIKTNVNAYDAFLKGQYFRQQHDDKESLGKALQYFKQAVNIDPHYVRAWVRMGGIYVNRYLQGYCSKECYAKANEALERALSIEPNSADALSLKGFMTMTFDWDLAMRLIRGG